MKTTRAGAWIYGIGQAVTLLLIALTAALMLGAGWLLLEPRELPRLTRQIQETLNHRSSAYHLKVTKTILALGDFAHPLNVIIKDVELRGYKSEEAARIPAMHVSLDLWSLLSGRVIPGRITLIEPKLSLYQAKDGVVYLSGIKTKKLIALHTLFAASAEEEEQDAALFDEAIEEVKIDAASLHFESALKKMKLTIPAADMIIRQRAGVFRGNIQLKADQEGKKQDLVMSSDFTYEPASHQITLMLKFDDLILADYAEILPELATINEIKLPLSGSVEVGATLPLQLKKINANITSGAGSFRLEPYFPQVVNVQQLQLKGWLDAVQGKAKLEQFLLQQKKAKLTASGEGSRDAEGKIAVQGQAKVLNLSHKILMKLWPEMLSPQTRKWVAESIVKGQIPEADFTLNAPAGSLETMPFPDEMLKAEIKLSDAEVDYVSGFPHVTQGQGVLHLRGNSLRLEIAQAKMLENAMLTGAGTLTIPDLMADAMEINIELPVTAGAKDVVNFIAATPYKLPESLNFKPETIAGDLQGHVKLQVLDNISPTPDDVTFTIESDVTNFSQPAFYKGMEVKGAAGKLVATDKTLAVDATGALQGQPLKFAAEINGKQEDYHLKAKLPHESLKQFGIDTEPYVIGPIGVDLHWKEAADGAAKIDAQADLTSSLIAIDDIEYRKLPGEAASLSLQGISQHEMVTLDNFRLTIPSRQEEVEGSARISQAAGRIEEVNFRKLHFAGTQAVGTYRPIPGGYYVHATGDKLDISYRDHEEEKEKKTAEPAAQPPKNPWKIPALDLDMAFNEVIVSKDQTKKLHDLKLTMQCDTLKCSQMNMQMNAGKSAPFSLKIGMQNGRRTLTSYTPRADIVLREMNIFDDMQGGEMQIIGIYQDDKPNYPLVGKLTIGEHRVKNVPVLTKLLTVATFTGIVDSLTGSGLMFQKLAVPFTMENFIVHLKDAKTAGPSIGITADGSLDLNQGKMNLRGAVIPAYMFNALIRSIPVLGNVFGVLAGDGLVAMRYSMLGDTENPDVTVNPLSALTPGFLRGFFSIFEEADPIAKASEDTSQALQRLETELNQVKVPEAEAAKTAAPAEPLVPATVAAPVVPVQQKPASVLSPKVKPTEIK